MGHREKQTRWGLAAATVMFVAGFAGSAVAAATADDLSTFVYAYECSLVELIGRIHANPNLNRTDARFVILAPLDRKNSYVQCAFDEDDRHMVCEAASGFYAAKGDELRIWPDERQALARLGFSTDGSHGNFRRFFRFRNTGEFVKVADLLLTALYQGYGVRMGETIEVVAPFALRHGVLPKDRCVPVS